MDSTVLELAATGVAIKQIRRERERKKRSLLSCIEVLIGHRFVSPTSLLLFYFFVCRKHLLLPVCQKQVSAAAAAASAAAAAAVYFGVSRANKDSKCFSFLFSFQN